MLTFKEQFWYRNHDRYHFVTKVSNVALDKIFQLLFHNTRKLKMWRQFNKPGLLTFVSWTYLGPVAHIYTSILWVAVASVNGLSMWKAYHHVSCCLLIQLIDQCLLQWAENMIPYLVMNYVTIPVLLSTRHIWVGYHNASLEMIKSFQPGVWSFKLSKYICVMVFSLGDNLVLGKC